MPVGPSAREFLANMESIDQSLQDDCFEQVYKDHYLKVYLSVYWSLRCCRGRQQREEAEDTAQEVFKSLLRELQHRPDLRHELAADASLLGRLLHKIVVSKVIDHKRKSHLSLRQSVERTDYIEEISFTNAANGWDGLAQEYARTKTLNPEERSILRETLCGSEVCMDTLSPKQRVALILKYGAGLSIKEIAAILRETEKTVQHSILPLAYGKFEARLKKWLQVVGIDPASIQKLLELFIESKEPLKGACPSPQELIQYIKRGVVPSGRLAIVEHIAVCRLCWKTVSELDRVGL